MPRSFDDDERRRLQEGLFERRAASQTVYGGRKSLTVA